MIDAKTVEDDNGNVVVSNVKCDNCSSEEKLSVVESKVGLTKNIFYKF